MQRFWFQYYLYAFHKSSQFTYVSSFAKTLATELHGQASDTFWAGTSYLLTSAVVQPFVIALSDVFGRRALLLSSITIFTVGTVTCCVAHDFVLLLSGRSIQGIGGGGCLVLTQVIITDIIPLRQRSAYQSMTSLSWAISTITGPLIGGSFVQRSTWKWCFYINFPFCMVSFVMSAMFIRIDTPRPNLTLVEKMRSIDWIGGLLSIGSTTSILIGVTRAGPGHSWSSAQTLVPLILGIIFLGATICYEVYGTKEPFLRLKLFKKLGANAGFFCAFLQGLSMFLLLYYIPFYFASCRNASPRSSGIDLIPITATLMPISIIISLLLKKTGRFRWAIWTGWVLTALSAGLLIILDSDTPIQHWIPIFVLVGLGHGMIIMALITCVQAAAPPGHVAEAAAAYMFLRSFGMCCGVALGGTVFQNTLNTHLRGLGLDVSVARDAEAFVSTLQAMGDKDVVKARYVSAYVRSFQNMWEVLTALSVLGLLSSALIEAHTMDRKLDNAHLVRGKRKSQASMSAI
jgi:MFS family permease